MRALVVLILLWSGAASAATLTIWFKTPTTNQFSSECFTQTDSGLVALPGTPLTDLRDVIVKLRSFSNPADTLTNYIPYTGTDSMGMSIQVKDGTIGDARAWSRDQAGNVSCFYASLVFAFPATGPTPPPPPSDSTGLSAEFYLYDVATDSKIFQFARSDTAIAFNWGFGAAWPGGPTDYWAATWVGTLRAPVAGTYSLCLDHNDGVRFWIDGALVIDQWGDSNAEACRSVSLTPGYHPIRIEYREGFGTAHITFSWSGPGIPKQAIPSAYLSP